MSKRKMKNIIISILSHATVLLFVIMPYSCFARSYEEKYADVLKHYSNNVSDSLKYRAAQFLIENMDGHYSPEGAQITAFISMIETIEKKSGIKELNLAWNNASKYGGVIFVPDSGIVTSRMLISNIDEAFNAWTSAYWHSDIDFHTFCRYILPYRCSSEHIGGNWRSYFYKKYHDLIKEEKDIRKAFAIIKKAVFGDVILSNSYCPYAIDAITCHRIGKAECGQRSILLVDVLRSLGFPAVIDMIPMWSDYSNKSHSWVSIVWNNTTYTVNENDAIAKEDNPIDASMFETRYHVKKEDNCPYYVKTTKTPVKVYREEYWRETDNTFPTNSLLHDVSKEYGLNSHVTLNTDTDKEVFLCTYLSANDWKPIAKQKAINRKVVFNNVGKNTVCTAYTIEDSGERKYITPPFLVGTNGIEKTFVADNMTKEKIRINRKYPLCQYTIDVWGYMRGGTFLGANMSDFSDADTLAVISAMPHGDTYVKCKKKREIQFL